MSEKLEVLKLRGCSYQGRKTITSAGITAIARCEKLQTLKLYDYSLIDDAAIHELAIGCPQMRHLSLPACSGLSGDALVAIPDPAAIRMWQPSGVVTLPG